MRGRIKFLPLLAVLLLAGCIVSGNFIIVYKLSDTRLTSNDDFERWEVSKELEEDWEDHAEDIKHIVDVGFAMKITNNNPTQAATGDVYISRNGNLSSAAEVIAEGIPVLTDMEVAADSELSISWRKSYDYLSNFDVLKQYIIDGEFYAYAIGVGTALDVDLTRIAVIITVNVAK